MTKQNVLERLYGGVVVSCQAHEGEPLYGSGMMRYMALAAVQGGAVGIRCNGADIEEIRDMVDVPLIGIVKMSYPGSEVVITPTMDEVALVAASGAEIVAIDGTLRPRPGGADLQTFIRDIRGHFPELLLMADISTWQEAMAAEKLGADLVATTLSGYTAYTKGVILPDVQLIRELAGKLRIPIVAEGGIQSPEQAAACLQAGAKTVVVGSAITRPHEITGRFVQALL